MGEPKFTKGPWDADFDTEPGRDIPVRVNLPCINGVNAWFQVGSAFCFEISEIEYTDGVLHDDAVVANAHLIAAAPYLYDMLVQARACIAYCRRTHPDVQNGDGVPIEALIDAALAKARGEA